MTSEFRNTLIWLATGTIAVFMSMNAVTASYHAGEYLPVSNDSFYHARRILDTVEDPAQFFEFDERIHVPEGSWITWPWLYDYSTARLVAGIAKVTGVDDPVPILMYVPVFWAFVTIGLMLLIAGELGLSPLFRTIACLSVALSPLTQILHGTGVVDHHYMEYTFVLLVLLGGLRWFAMPESTARAVFLGFVLGIASGFHNGMFILQLPVLAGVYLMWSRGQHWQWPPILGISAGLTGGVLLVLIPSQPFLEGVFQYYYLSWFHLYIAICTGLALCLVANRPWSVRSLLIIAGIGIALTIPLFRQVLSMENFLSKDLARFDVILETKSPLELSLSNPQLWLVDFFSLLTLLAPLVWIGAAWMVLRSRIPKTVFFSVMVIFGLSLYILQVRLHYFGSFAVVLGPLLLAKYLKEKTPARAGWITGLVVLVYLGSYIGPVSNRLFSKLPLGLDAQYGLVKAAIPRLTEACDEEPGVVLAFNDLGHYIRYHTECSVVANNFLLTAQHARKIEELDHLLSLSLERLIEERPDIRYLFVSLPFLFLNLPDGTRIPATREDLEVMNGRWPLMVDLLLDDQYSAGRLDLLADIRVTQEDDEFAIVRLFKIPRGTSAEIDAQP